MLLQTGSRSQTDHGIGGGGIGLLATKTGASLQYSTVPVPAQIAARPRITTRTSFRREFMDVPSLFKVEWWQVNCSEGWRPVLIRFVQSTEQKTAGLLNGWPLW